MPLTSNAGDHIMTSTIHCGLYDLLYRAGPEDPIHWVAELADYGLRLGNRIRRGLSRSRAGCSPTSFGILLSTVARSSILGLSSVTAQLCSGSSVGTRVFPSSTISRGANRGFLCFGELEHVVPADACRPEDGQRHRPVLCQAMLNAHLLPPGR
jgi:hypothetical protein